MPIRVHVNGTRGKSTVTRLIAGALREAGVPTLGKVTGTAARWLLPDGSEEAVRRGRTARISEQLTALRKAAAMGCQALVAECMAIRPELQWAAEHVLLHSTVGVITNARLDHVTEMGWTPATIARSLANTVPSGGVVVVGEPWLAKIVEPVAARRRSRVVVASSTAAERMPAHLQDRLGLHDPANLAVALEVARVLGIPENVAWEGMARAAVEPGHARYCRAVGNRSTPCLLVDATAVNDPDSLERVLGGICGGTRARQVQLIYHHRRDRPERALVFARWVESLTREPRTGRMGGLPLSVVPDVIVTGDASGVPIWRRVSRMRARYGGATPGAALRLLEVTRHSAWSTSQRDTDLPAPECLIVVCGNTRSAGDWQADFGPWWPAPLGGRVGVGIRA